MRPPLLRFLKYSVVGVSTFVFDLLILLCFIDVLGLDPVASAAIAYLIAVSVNYMLSRHFVFMGSLREVGSGYLLFVVIALFGAALVTSGMYVLATILGVHYMVSRVLIAAISGFWNYLMNLYVNFKVAGKHGGIIGE